MTRVIIIPDSTDGTTPEEIKNIANAILRLLPSGSTVTRVIDYDEVTFLHSFAPK